MFFFYLTNNFKELSVRTINILRYFFIKRRLFFRFLTAFVRTLLKIAKKINLLKIKSHQKRKDSKKLSYRFSVTKRNANLNSAAKILMDSSLQILKYKFLITYYYMKLIIKYFFLSQVIFHFSLSLNFNQCFLLLPSYV